MTMVSVYVAKVVCILGSKWEIKKGTVHVDMLAYKCHDISVGHAKHSNLLAFIIEVPLPSYCWWLRTVDVQVCLK